MRVPLSWLRDYVALDMPVEDLAARLDVSTAVVAAMERIGVPDVDGNSGLFRVGKVLEAGKHPNADRLQLCKVDVGEPEPYQIVCGAWNFGAGATVAVALPGATLPGGLELERRELRGEVSEDDPPSASSSWARNHTGIIVLGGRGRHAPRRRAPLSGRRARPRDHRQPAGPALRPRRRARGRGALRARARPPPGREPETGGTEPVGVSIEDYEGCPRYIGRLFRDVGIRPSPTWLRARLNAAGMRPISNVVDVTNYVMLGLGNLAHAFDFATLAGGEIVVRRAAPARRCGRWTGRPRPRGPRPHDRRRGAGDRARRDHGRGETEISEGTSDVPAGGGELRADGALADVRAPAPADRGLESLGERCGPVPRGARATGRPARGRPDRAPGRAHGRQGDCPSGPLRRPERASASVGSMSPRSSTASPTRLGLERRDGATSCRRGAPATARWTRRGGRALRARRRPVHAPGPAGDERPAEPTAAGRRRVEDTLAALGHRSTASSWRPMPTPARSGRPDHRRAVVEAHPRSSRSPAAT